MGLRSIIGSGAKLTDTVLMGADFYESAADRERNAAAGIPDIGIGAGTVISGAIVDKNARIGVGSYLCNDEGAELADGDGYVIRDGIVVIPKNSIVPAGTRI